MKRFSARETALLMLPVLAVGALSWWLSNRPPAPHDGGPLHLQFRVEAPTTLEAFRGFEGAFVVEAKDRQGTSYRLSRAAPYLELKTARDTLVSRLSGGTSGFWTDVWGSNNNNSRFTFNTQPLPPGTLHFGFDGFAESPPSSAPRPALTRVSGKWKVDRANIQPPNLAAMPREPLVSLREVVVTQKTAGSVRWGMPDEISAEAVFDLNGAAMNQESPFEFSIRNRIRPATGPTYGMSWGHSNAKDTPRRRVRSWTVNTSPGNTAKARVSGRVSAANRWPLGFEIEPFDFQTAKVGQKLGFKQFPVALPPNTRP